TGCASPAMWRSASGGLLRRLDQRPKDRFLRIKEVFHTLAGPSRNWQKLRRRNQSYGSRRHVQVYVHLLTHDIEQPLLRFDKSISSVARQLCHLGLLLDLAVVWLLAAGRLCGLLCHRFEEFLLSAGEGLHSLAGKLDEVCRAVVLPCFF